MARTDGPIISGSTLGPKSLKLEEPQLLTKGLTDERFMCAKSEKENFRCQTELEFILPGEEKSVGVPKGTRMALHKCVRPGSKEGSFIPVTSAADALRVGEEFCACVDAVQPPPKPVPKSVIDGRRIKCARTKR